MAKRNFFTKYEKAIITISIRIFKIIRIKTATQNISPIFPKTDNVKMIFEYY